AALSRTPGTWRVGNLRGGLRQTTGPRPSRCHAPRGGTYKGRRCHRGRHRWALARRGGRPAGRDCGKSPATRLLTALSMSEPQTAPPPVLLTYERSLPKLLWYRFAPFGLSVAGLVLFGVKRR